MQYSCEYKVGDTVLGCAPCSFTRPSISFENRTKCYFVQIDRHVISMSIFLSTIQSSKSCVTVYNVPVKCDITINIYMWMRLHSLADTQHGSMCAEEHVSSVTVTWNFKWCSLLNRIVYHISAALIRTHNAHCSYYCYYYWKQHQQQQQFIFLLFVYIQNTKSNILSHQLQVGHTHSIRQHNSNNIGALSTSLSYHENA